MITPIEIQNKTFKNGLGYEKKDVDQFMYDILDSFETIYKENVELNDKINVLNEGLRYYKSIEKTLQRALTLAEKTAENTRQSAQKEAERLEKEAVMKAEMILSEAHRELEKMHSKIIQFVQQYEKYKIQFKNLAASQVELLESDTFKLDLSEIESISDIDLKVPEVHMSVAARNAAAAEEAIANFNYSLEEKIDSHLDFDITSSED